MFVPINFGYYRIYWKNGGEPAYVHEIYKWMPYRGYMIEQKDENVDSQRYFEEYEDQIEVTRKLKNYVEGYTDSMNTLVLRMYQLKNDKEFRSEATKAYRRVVVK